MDECDFETLSAMLDADEDVPSQPAPNAHHNLASDSSSDDDISDSELDRLAALVEQDAETEEETQEVMEGERGRVGDEGGDKENQCNAEVEEEEDEISALYARIKQLEAKKTAKKSLKSPKEGTSSQSDSPASLKSPQTCPASIPNSVKPGAIHGIGSAGMKSLSTPDRNKIGKTASTPPSKPMSAVNTPSVKALNNVPQPSRTSLSASCRSAPPAMPKQLHTVKEDIFGTESSNIELPRKSSSALMNKEKSMVKSQLCKSDGTDNMKETSSVISSFYGNKKAGEDSDSDWEGLDGESGSTLSGDGREVKNLLRKNSSRVAHPGQPVAKTEELRKAATLGEEKRSKDYIARACGIPPAAVSAQQPPKIKPKSTDDSKVQLESFSKIRIINPRIPSLTLTALMEGRQFIATSQIQRKSGSQALEGDWVTIAVVVGKTESRKSSKGSDYMVWRLSDLADCEKVVSCFLFNSAYKQHWKTMVGSVIGILNPTIMDNTEKYQSSSSDCALSVDNDKKVLSIGQSRDFALCRAKTKAGKDCSQFVNLQKGEYCIFHVQSAYKKHSAKRAELQAGFSGVTPKSFEQKVFSKSSITVNYGGQTFTTAGPPPKSKRTSSTVTLQSLQNHHISKGPKGQPKVTPLSLHDLLPEDKEILNRVKSGKAAPAKKHAEFMDLLSKPTPGAIQFVKHLQMKDKKPGEVVAENPKKVAPMVSLSAKDFLKQHEREMKEKMDARRARLATEPGVLPSSTGSLPQLGRGLAPGQDMFIDLNDPSAPAPVLTKTDINAAIAKRKAVAKIKNLGGLTKVNPNATKKRKNEVDLEQMKQRAAGSQVSPEASSTKSDTPPRKKSRFAGSLDLHSTDVQKLLSAKSSHDNILTEAEAEKMDEYFEVLEKKEAMEEKMASITKVAVTAVHCKQCKYHALGPSAICKENRHKLEYYKTYKRYFKCKKCSKRTVCIDKIPSLACSNCGSTSYERTTMLNEKKGPMLPQDQLLLRGEEAKNLNSL